MMTTNQLWFVRHGNVVLGQFPLKEIVQGISAGEILLADEISPDQVNWLPLSGFPGLAPEKPDPIETPPDEELDEETRKWRQERIKASVRWEADPGAHQAADHMHAPNPVLKWLGITLALVAVAALGVFVMWQSQIPEETPKLEITPPIPSCAATPAPKVNWSGCDKSGTLLSGSDLSNANLSRTKFNSTDLSGSRLVSANLMQADLSYTTLNKANLSRANLTGANLNFAEMREADLSGANLRDANLADAVLDGAKLDGATWPDGRVCAANSIGQCL
jgi:hypothetical protein